MDMDPETRMSLAYQEDRTSIRSSIGIEFDRGNLRKVLKRWDLHLLHMDPVRQGILLQDSLFLFPFNLFASYTHGVEA